MYPAQPTPPAPPRRGGRRQLVIAAAAGAVIAAGGGIGLAAGLTGHGSGRPHDVAAIHPAAAATHVATPTPVKTVYRTKTVHRTKIVHKPVAVQPAAPAQTDPWAVVSEYYGDVTSGDYSGAWALLGPGMRSNQGSYAGFVDGYTGTGSQDVYEVSESGDQVTYYLESDNPDGTVQYYEATGTVYDGQLQSADVTQLAGNPNS